MRKTDDGFCCAFNTITWREEYDQSEYEDDNYNNEDDNYNNDDYNNNEKDDDGKDYDEKDNDEKDYIENYIDGEATTSTESSHDTVTYPGSIKD